MADPIATKVTIFFEGTTLRDGGIGVGRKYGFTESYYFPGAPADAVKNLKGTGKLLQGPGLASARAVILPTQCDIVGYRVQQVSPLPVGPSDSDTLSYRGLDVRTDMPQVSIRVRLKGLATTNFRVQVVRCIPDEYILNGEFTPTQQFQNKVDSFVAALSGWSFKAKDKDQNKIPIIEITIAGVVETGVAHALIEGNKVQIGRGRTIASRKSFAGVFRVSKVTDATHFTIDPYLIPLIVRGGYCQKLLTIYPGIDTINSKVGKSTTKKVGRPFDVFIGRQSGRK